MTKRLHCDIIIAWAKGSKIEVFVHDEWHLVHNPRWFKQGVYRIAEEKGDVPSL